MQSRKALSLIIVTFFEKVMRENNIPILVYNMNVKGNLEKVVEGETIGTLVH